MYSTVSTQEHGDIFGLASKLSNFAFDYKLDILNSNGYSSLLSNYLYFDGKFKAVASLGLSSRRASTIRKLFNEFNRAIRFHSERIPLGFASVRIGSGNDNGCDVLEEEGLQLNGVESESPKKVLILMSDTGGGHRASAEAIKAAFSEEFGDEYQVVQ